MTTSIKPTEDLLAKWKARCNELQYAHYTAERVYANLNYALGIPVVALSAVAGTSAFASLQAETANQNMLIVTGLVSMSAAILASLQTFLRFSERAEKHRASGARYGAIKRRIEQMQTGEKDNETDRFLDSIREQCDRLAEEAPGVSGTIFRRARAHMQATEEEKNEPSCNV